MDVSGRTTQETKSSNYRDTGNSEFNFVTSATSANNNKSFSLRLRASAVNNFFNL